MGHHVWSCGRLRLETILSRFGQVFQAVLVRLVCRTMFRSRAQAPKEIGVADLQAVLEHYMKAEGTRDLTNLLSDLKAHITWKNAPRPKTLSQASSLFVVLAGIAKTESYRTRKPAWHCKHATTMPHVTTPAKLSRVGRTTTARSSGPRCKSFARWRRTPTRTVGAWPRSWTDTNVFFEILAHDHEESSVPLIEHATHYAQCGDIHGIQYTSECHTRRFAQEVHKHNPCMETYI